MQTHEISILIDALKADGAAHGDAVSVTPLTGGVSSEIYLVNDDERRFVVKRALAKLRVAEEWKSDIRRNSHEQKYLKYVASILPQAVPRILFANDERGYFGMEYLGEGFSNWKALLLSGNCLPDHASAAAAMLAAIHCASAGRPEIAAEFDTTENFRQLRTDPYLVTAGSRHPALREMFEAEARRLEGVRECLVHGDFSPKNILISDGRIILLDCEVAWYGDPSFDLAFLLNHFLLKALHHAPRSAGLEELFEAACVRYFEVRGLPAQAEADFNRRTARLLLMLLLARVDGKSPVEYLAEEKKEFVRRFSTDRLLNGRDDLDAVCDEWFARISHQFPNS